MTGFIRITTRPHSEAPEWVRDSWIGLVLPVEKVLDENAKLVGALSNALVTEVKGGYRVNWHAAMDALEKKSPAAREWWDEHKNDFNNLTFDKSCCMPVPF